MLQTTRAARLQFRLRRLPGYGEARVRYVTSPGDFEGDPGDYAGTAFYLYDPTAEPPSWYWIGKFIDGADTRVRLIERASKGRPPAPSPAEVFGVVMQVIGVVLGIVKEMPRTKR